MKFIQDFLTVLYGIFFFKGSFISLMGVNSSFLINSMWKQSSRGVSQVNAPTLISEGEQEEEFSDSPGNENTSEEEENTLFFIRTSKFCLRLAVLNFFFIFEAEMLLICSYFPD